MIDPDTELLLYKSASHPTDDTTPAGGAISSPRVEIEGAVAGELLTRLRALASGTIDNPIHVMKQWQKAFFENLSATDDLLDAKIFLKNGEKRPASPGTARVVTTDAADDDTKKCHVWGVLDSSGQIDEEDIIFPSTPGEAAGSKTWTFILRRVIRDVATGAQVTAADDVGLKVGTENTGIIPAGRSWATEEFQLAVPATTGDSGTSTNRRTPPAGLTFTRAYDATSAIPIRNDSGDDTLAHGENQGFWVQQFLQPGMPPTPPTLELVLRLEGDST